MCRASYTIPSFPPADEAALIFYLSILLLLFMFGSFVTLVSGVPAPYGRYNDHAIGGIKLGALVPARLAWAIQESPCVVASIYAAYRAPADLPLPNRVVLLLFGIHYFNRTVLYPLRIRGGKATPLVVMLLAFGFCSINGFIQTRFLVAVCQGLEFSLLFYAGVLVWALGFLLNIQSDNILQGLRPPGDTSYKIPRGGLFELVSGANFLAEIIEWTGYAMAMNFAFPGVSFALCTALNIGPRAVQHHKWYLTKFDNYPKHRKALIPFLL
eukprot:c3310_g1_i1.p1 GENE.c3310_g1_i1~~c3310_g1_i1.p1  ORF type:complete len:276 (+),score=55.10 c3310_g1_i1:24-830(+)